MEFDYLECVFTRKYLSSEENRQYSMQVFFFTTNGLLLIKLKEYT